MTLVIVSISAIWTAGAAYVLSLNTVFQVEFSDPQASFCWYYEDILKISTVMPVILGLPLYEVCIHPLIRKKIPSTLKRVGLAHTLIVITSLILLVSSTIWYVYNSPTKCMFASSASSESPFLVDGNLIEALIGTLTWAFGFCFLTAILEFVCAQSPYILRGLLIGLVYSVVLCSILLGFGTYGVWEAVYKGERSDNPSCGVWFYLFTTTATILGCVLWCAVAKWYKKRERDEPEMYRIFAENYYSH